MNNPDKSYFTQEEIDELLEWLNALTLAEVNMLKKFYDTMKENNQVFSQ